MQDGDTERSCGLPRGNIEVATRADAIRSFERFEATELPARFE